MAVDNFKPTLWEGALLHNFHSVSIADVMCTKPSNVNGKTVTFNRVAAGSLKDYSGTVDWAEIETTPVEMTFDKKKYFAFALDDVDKVQLKADVMTATTQEHSAVLAEQYDKDFFVALTTGVKLKIGAAGSKKKVTPANAYDYIVDLGTMLSEKKVPKTERYVTVNAAYLGLLSKDKRFTANPNVLANGVVEGQKINGMQADKISKQMSKTAKVGETLSRTGAALTKGLTVPLAGAAIATTKMAVDFESSFAKVSTLLDDTVVDFDNYKDSLIAGSNETKVAVDEYSEAVYQAISAGVDQTKAVEFTTDAMKLAKGGFTSGASAVDIMTTANRTSKGSAGNGLLGLHNL